VPHACTPDESGPWRLGSHGCGRRDVQPLPGQRWIRSGSDDTTPCLKLQGAARVVTVCPGRRVGEARAGLGCFRWRGLQPDPLAGYAALRARETRSPQHSQRCAPVGGRDLERARKRELLPTPGWAGAKGLRIRAEREVRISRAWSASRASTAFVVRGGWPSASQTGGAGSWRRANVSCERRSGCRTRKPLCGIASAGSLATRQVEAEPWPMGSPPLVLYLEPCARVVWAAMGSLAVAWDLRATTGHGCRRSARAAGLYCQPVSLST
jgi:hypothetical protein